MLSSASSCALTVTKPRSIGKALGAGCGVRSSFTCQDGSSGPATWTSAHSYSEQPDHPVTGISYYEALAFLAWLSRTVVSIHVSNLSASRSRPPIPNWINMQWCLPTENMWEFAARGASGLLYSWGWEFEEGRCNSREANMGTTSAVGRFPNGRSAFGADDMAGNVWEIRALRRSKPLYVRTSRRRLQKHARRDQELASLGGCPAESPCTGLRPTMCT